MTMAFLIAANERQAQSWAAAAEWGKLALSNMWKSHRAENVQYVREARSMRGCSRGTIVYLAPGYQCREDIAELLQMTHQRGYVTSQNLQVHPLTCRGNDEL